MSQHWEFVDDEGVPFELSAREVEDALRTGVFEHPAKHRKVPDFKARLNLWFQSTERMTTATALSIEIKKLKTFRGMEGVGFNCEVWLDGKRAGSCIDDATGGPLRFEHDWNKEARAKLDAYAATLPREPFGSGMSGDFQPDADIVIENAVNECELAKKVGRMIKSGKVVVRVGKDIFTYKAKLDERLRAQIAKDSKGDAFTIFNDDPKFVK